MKTQNFNIDALLGNLPVLFSKFVLAVIIIFLFLQVINFLSAKFINQEQEFKALNIESILIIFNKIFIPSGFGFIIANIIHSIITEVSNSYHFSGWQNLIFGIVLIFVGFGAKFAAKSLNKAL